MKIIIFDDDIDFSKYLEKLIKQNFIDVTIDLITSDIAVLHNYLAFSDEPTIFFLDIMLNGSQQGLKISDAITRKGTNEIIIFITDYPNKILLNSFYKIKAFNVILKRSPKLEDEIKTTVSLALTVLSSSLLLVYSDKFTAISIDKSRIIYIETIKGKNKVCIYHENGIYQIRTSLNEIIRSLSPCFVRCHNSYIVNLNKIQEIRNRERKIIMQNGGVCYYSYLKRKSLGRTKSGETL